MHVVSLPCVFVCVCAQVLRFYVHVSQCVCVCMCVCAQVRRGRRRKSVKTVPPVPAKKGSVVTLETVDCWVGCLMRE